MIKALISTIICILIALIGFKIKLGKSKMIQECAKRLYKKRVKFFVHKTRQEKIELLATRKYDLLIIGGGCSGAGCALDAASRGLKVALIESSDFGSETSSKSTKMLHGGIRYLEKAINKLSFGQLRLVLEALSERKRVMIMAPYLTYTVRIMIPIYKKCMVPYYWFLAILYDWLSWGHTLGRSYLISKERSNVYFRFLKNDNFKGSMVYYDGMMDDARINVMLAMTSSFYGADCVNHMTFLEFKDHENSKKIKKILCVDNFTNKKVEISAKVVISCTGAFTNEIIKKERDNAEDVIEESAGAHMVLPPEFGPVNIGLIEMKTTDNRKIFVLPWKGQTLIGATETKRQIKKFADPLEDDISFLINETKQYILKDICKSDVKSVWTAFRPLVKSNSSLRTESIIRSYNIKDNGNRVIYMYGGKWTTFRISSKETVDLAIRNYGLEPRNGCLTEYLSILGAEKYSRDMFYEIARSFNVEFEYAKHLLGLYGSRALMMGKYISDYPDKLSEKYHFREGEVIYCVENEDAMTTDGIVNIRFRVGYFDVKEAFKMCQKVDKILKKYFNWTDEEVQFNRNYTKQSLRALGYDILCESDSV